MQQESFAQHRWHAADQQRSGTFRLTVNAVP
jgi:hypothetical protein